ncbi:MAG: hypothetical protein GX556_18665 [Fibrobacter sp.]|nr:hypothetical protein [Fibrobacter sp.]
MAAQRVFLLSILLCIGAFCDPVLKLNVPGHSGPVVRVSVSQDGELILSGSSEGKICLWRGCGELLREYHIFGEKFSGMLYSCALSPDGAAAAANYRVNGEFFTTLFSAENGGLYWKKQSPGAASDLEFSSDGKYLASGLLSGRGVIVYDVQSGESNLLLSGCKGSVYSLDYHISGKLIAAFSTGEVILYNEESVEEGRFYSPVGKVPCSAAFSPEGNLICIGYERGGGICMLDVFTMAPRESLAVEGTVVLDWEEDNVLRAVSSGKESFLVAWTQRNGWRREKMDGSSFYDLKVLPGGRFTACGYGGVGIYDRYGEKLFFSAKEKLDIKEIVPGSFELSSDGSLIDFEFSGLPPLTFSVSEKMIIRSDFIGKARKKRAEKVTVPSALYGRGKVYSADKCRAGIVIGSGDDLLLSNTHGDIIWRAFLGSPAVAVSVSERSGQVAAALLDGTIRWVDLRSGVERLALYIKKDLREWVMWTPANHWEASKGGAELLCWSQSEENSFLLKRYSTLVLGKEKRGIEVSEPDKKKIDIKIVTPSDGDTVRDTLVVLVVKQIDSVSDPLTSISLQVNGKSQLTTFRGIVPKEKRFLRNIAVLLKPGHNYIKVNAFSGGSFVSSDQISLYSAPCVKPARKLIKPHLRAVLAGISTYSNSGLNLCYASRDASDMSKELSLQEGGLYGSVQRRVLIDSSATRSSILEELERLGRGAQAGDVTVIFLAGHGVYDSDRLAYFVPFDGDTSRLRRTCIPFSELKYYAGKITGKVMLFLDACFSGAIISGARAFPLDISSAAGELLSAAPGLFIFASSAPSQISREDPLWSNGAFTRALLEGLRGGADYSGDGIITAGMLDLFICKRVKELTGGRQTPLTLRSPGMSDFPFAVTNSRSSAW